MKIYQFYAELENYKPKMWRRFQVDADITVAQLGYTVMSVYEMMASHLLLIEHERQLRTPSGRKSQRTALINRYSIPNEEANEIFGFEDEDATIKKLSELDLTDLNRLLVWYDFGDDWRVIVTLEEIKEGNMSVAELPYVIRGKGFGIMEDCGGVYGLMDLADAFEEKQGEAYEGYREWLGIDELDLKKFDIKDANFRLRRIPKLYQKIYEGGYRVMGEDIDFLERRY